MELSLNEISTMKWSFDRDVEEYARLGVAAIGVSKSKLLRYGKPAGLRLLKESGLRASCLFTGTRFAIEEPAGWPAQREVMLADIDLAAELQAGKVVVLTGPAVRPHYSEAAAHFVAQVRELLPFAQASGVRLALEHHLGVALDVSFVNQAHDAYDLADEVDSPWFGVNLELTHALTERWLYEDIATRASRIIHVQSGDYKLGTRTTSDRVPLGDGCLPLARTFDALENAGYKGYLDVETHGPQTEALGYEESLRRSVAWWRQYEASRALRQ